MKRLVTMAGLAVAMTLGQTLPAQAINREWSAALGFVGGVLATRAHDYRQMRRDYDRTVVVQQPMVVERVVYEQPRRPSGHYELRDERVWVPGNWVYEEVGCNTYRKVWTEGYYRVTTVRVWVSDNEVCMDR